MAQPAASPPRPTGPQEDGAVPKGIAGRPGGKDRAAASDAAVFTIAVYAAQAILFVAGVVHKALLGPLAAGYWALMQSAWPFMSMTSLGAYNGTTRQVPLRRGRGDYAAAAALANSGNSFSLLTMAVVGTLVAAAALAFGSGWPAEIRWGLVLLGLTAPLRFLSDCHEVLLKVMKQFPAVSAGTIVKAVITLTLQTALVYMFGVYGMFAGVAAAAFGTLLLWTRMGLTGLRRPAFVWAMDRARLRELIAYGFPIMVWSQVWLLFKGVDNLIVAAYIDVTNLGYYAMAVSVVTYMLYLPKSIGTVLFPRIVERFGRTGEIGSIGRYATESQHVLAFALIPSFAAVAFFVGPVLVRHLLPAFEPAIPVIQIMVAASFFLSLCNMPIQILLTAGHRLTLILLATGCLGVNAVANYLAVAELGWGLSGAALATAFSYLIVFLVTSGYGLHKAVGLGAMLAHIAELLAAFAYMTAALWGIELLLGSGAGPFLSDALASIAKLGLFLLLLAPGLALVQRRNGALSTMWSLVRTAARKVLRSREGS